MQPYDVRRRGRHHLVDDPGGDLRDVDDAADRLETSLDPARLEDVEDEPLEPLRLRLDRLERVAALLGTEPVAAREQHLRPALDRDQWRPQLV